MSEGASPAEFQDALRLIFDLERHLLQARDTLRREREGRAVERQGYVERLAHKDRLLVQLRDEKSALRRELKALGGGQKPYGNAVIIKETELLDEFDKSHRARLLPGDRVDVRRPVGEFLRVTVVGITGLVAWGCVRPDPAPKSCERERAPAASPGTTAASRDPSGPILRPWGNATIIAEFADKVVTKPTWVSPRLDLQVGARVAIQQTLTDVVIVATPDGRTGWVPKSCVRRDALSPAVAAAAAQPKNVTAKPWGNAVVVTIPDPSSIPLPGLALGSRVRVTFDGVGELADHVFAILPSRHGGWVPKSCLAMDKMARVERRDGVFIGMDLGCADSEAVFATRTAEGLLVDVAPAPPAACPVPEGVACEAFQSRLEEIRRLHGEVGMAKEALKREQNLRLRMERDFAEAVGARPGEDLRVVALRVMGDLRAARATSDAESNLLRSAREALGAPVGTDVAAAVTEVRRVLTCIREALGAQINESTQMAVARRLAELAEARGRHEADVALLREVVEALGARPDEGVLAAAKRVAAAVRDSESTSGHLSDLLGRVREALGAPAGSDVLTAACIAGELATSARANLVMLAKYGRQPEEDAEAFVSRLAGQLERSRSAHTNDVRELEAARSALDLERARANGLQLELNGVNASLHAMHEERAAVEAEVGAGPEPLAQRLKSMLDAAHASLAQAQAVAESWRRDMQEHLAANARLRVRLGAGQGETLDAFVERLAGEASKAGALGALVVDFAESAWDVPAENRPSRMCAAMARAATLLASPAPLWREGTCAPVAAGQKRRVAEGAGESVRVWKVERPAELPGDWACSADGVEGLASIDEAKLAGSPLAEDYAPSRGQTPGA